MRKVEKWVFSRFPKEEWPQWEKKKDVEGEAYVKAWPILGIEKYLGMWDSERRLPYFPSLKLTNDSYTTYMYARFDPSLKEDVIIFDGSPAKEKDKKRFMKIINRFRELTGVQTHVYINSRHVPKVGGIRGKGLGLSAAASGAAASALLLASGYRDLYGNKRFLSYLARYLSGSGTSSAAGGFSVWFGYEGIDEKESYAVKIDEGDWVELVIVPIPMHGFKTSSAHKAAVSSPFYGEWKEHKEDWVVKVMEGIEKRDLKVVGRHAERDAFYLTQLMSTGGDYNNWLPETMAVVQEVLKLRREKGLPIYYTMDTGPSVAIITLKGKGGEVKEILQERFPEHTVYVAQAAGSPQEITGAEIEKVKELLK